MTDLKPFFELPINEKIQKKFKKTREIIEFDPDDFEICHPKKITKKIETYEKKPTYITFICDIHKIDKKRSFDIKLKCPDMDI